MGSRNSVPFHVAFLALAISGMVAIVWLGQDFNPRAEPASLSNESKLLATIPEGMKFDFVTFSRNGRVVAYLDKTKEANRIVLNGKPGRAFAFI